MNKLKRGSVHVSKGQNDKPLKWFLIIGISLIAVAFFFSIPEKEANAQHVDKKRAQSFVGMTDETITVGTDTAVGLTVANIKERNPGPKTVQALISVAGNPINVFWGGSTPTSSLGHNYPIGSKFLVIGRGDLLNILFLNSAASGNSTLTVTYSKQSAL